MTPRRPFLGAPLAVLFGAALASAAWAAAPASQAAKTAASAAGAAPKDSLQAAPAPKPPAKPAPKAPSKDTAKATKPPAKDSAKAAAPRDSLPPPLRDIGQSALKAPEKLVFDVIWGGWNFRWVHAGKATLELLPTEKPAEWKIQSLAWCNKFFQTFYPVRDTVFSIIDSRGIYPLRFEKRLHEGSYHANVSAIYDQKAHTLATQDTLLDVEPFTHDVLSAFYYIRTQPLKVGDSFSLAAVSGKKKYNLKVLCHGREKVKVPAGEFQTLIVEPVLVGDGLFKAKGKLTIWVTDDARHMPVKMQSKIPVGSIKAELISRS